MLVEFGHPHPVDGQVVSELAITDDLEENGDYVRSYIVGTSGAQVRDHMFDVLNGATPHFGGNTAVADLVHWLHAHPEIGTDITWVQVEPHARDAAVADDFERFVAEYCRAARGKPADVEDTHWTWDGSDRLPPGVAPAEAV